MVYEWIERCLALPRMSREQPMNIAHLKLLLLIAENPDIKTDSLLEFFPNEKPTLISRINFLSNKGLIEKLPLFNRGGNTHPNYYRATPLGYDIVSQAFKTDGYRSFSSKPTSPGSSGHTAARG